MVVTVYYVYIKNQNLCDLIYFLKLCDVIPSEYDEKQNLRKQRSIIMIIQ